MITYTTYRVLQLMKECSLCDFPVEVEVTVSPFWMKGQYVQLRPPHLNVPLKDNQLVGVGLLQKRLGDNKLLRDGALPDTVRTPPFKISQ